jgi:hypothetical protein
MSEPRGERARLIEPTRARASHVELLQRDEVGIVPGDDVRDARHVEHSVRADAAVHVVRHRSEQVLHGAIDSDATPLPTRRVLERGLCACCVAREHATVWQSVSGE